MKFIYKNYEIDFLYDDSYNNITLNVENIESHQCYVKEFTIDTFNKLQFEKTCNINNVKSGIHFFEKVLNNQSGYTLHISENSHLLSSFKKVNILTMDFKGILESYFEIYCKFDIEEKLFSMEEKVFRMMEKMKGSYEYKINNIESQLNNLQNMILNISNIIGINKDISLQKNIVKVASEKNIVKVASETKIFTTNNIKEENEPFIGLNYEEQIEHKEVKEDKNEIIQNISIKKDKKNIKEIIEQNNNFYDTFYLSEDDNKDDIDKSNIIKENQSLNLVNNEIIPKKIFVTHYTHLVQNSAIPNVIHKWYNFVNNSDEHIILNIERPYLNLFISNHGKIFIFHTYGGLVNEISLQHYAEINGFENTLSIKDKINSIQELFKRYIDDYSECGDSKVNLLNFFKRIDSFIENII